MERKNIMIKLLRGFMYGCALLLFSYIVVFALTGDGVYKTEIMQIMDFKTLLLQITCSGVAYSLILTSFEVFENTDFNIYKNKLNSSWKLVFKFLIVFLVFIIASIFLSSKKIYSETIGIINIFILALMCLLNAIRVFINDTINKKV